ncbi:MAG: alkanesulfonate monooxygenase [Acidobacteriota bacterium]|nr:alkanesulfonate monooxygenase [Acidobacteriota bacterium]
MSLRFHWMLPKGGEVSVGTPQTPQESARYRLQATSSTSPAPRPDMKGWTRFARSAEQAGIESVLISFSRYEPDPFMVGCALGQDTEKLKFIVAYRSGLIQPTTFVQQTNTLSALIGGRVALNIVAGSSKAEQHGYGDFLAHDERYARADEFLAVCNSFWQGGEEVDFDGKYYRIEKGKLHTPFLAPGRSAPEIYVSGHSEQAERLALARGSCLLRVADAPEKLQTQVARMRECGVEVCLRLCVLCRPTREEAIGVAESLLPERDIPRQERNVAAKDDSQMYRESSAANGRGGGWLTGTLWAGLVPYHGPVWTTLLGTPSDIAESLLEYSDIGVTQFIMSGWPELDEVSTFGREVLPLVRRAEEGNGKRDA